MGDPELRSDETVLVRTQGVYVKSIPFEGILTNKRIILIDRAKNLLPPKEIPLATIKDIEGGENAIRDPFVTITVITRTGETRQMVLTFTRTAGGNRNKERDDWVKTLKDNVSSSFEQVIRKVIPGPDKPMRRPERQPSPRIEVSGTPVQPEAPRPLLKKEADTVPPIKKITGNVPSATPAASQEPVTTAPVLGTFCSRCGNKVPEGSVFCNRCGSSIIPPIGITPKAPAPQPAIPDIPAQVLRPDETEIHGIEPLIEPSAVKAPAEPRKDVIPESPAGKTEQRPYSPLYDNPPEPVTSSQPAPGVSAPPQKPAAKRIIPRLFSTKELSQTPLNPASMPTATPPAPQKPSGSGFMTGKKVFIAVGVVIILIIIAVAGMLVYPMIAGSGSSQPGGSLPSSVPVTTASSTPAPSGTLVVRETTPAPSVPSTGVYVHISYIGGWKGTYGMPSDLQTMELSGDHYYEILNATGPVEASFEKLDSSTRHDLIVEIYRNGGLLTSGKTSEGFGKVSVSADATTGVTQAPQVVTANVTAASTPAITVTAVTTIMTTVPVTNTTIPSV